MKPRNVWNNYGGIFDIPTAVEKLTDFEKRMSEPTFWDDKQKAGETVNEVSRLRNFIEPFRSLENEIEEFAAFGELVEDAADEGTEELLVEAAEKWGKIQKKLDQLELISYLSGRHDRNNAFLSVHAGAGGTESCDWASMLLRMYSRWAEKNEFEFSIVDFQEGEEAGLKSATAVVRGDFAYGYLKQERGVHRLVRISPFDSNKRRHTSFAAVDVVAEIEDDIEINIDEQDLRIDTYRSSGAGGQHVNKTDSAVRLTHLPTNIVVSCQNERSQHKNKAMAMKLLRAKLYEVEEEKRKREQEKIDRQKAENEWGNQIRSYVLHPYQMVKDLRTQVQTANTNDVLDGDIDMFIESMLKRKSNS